jgi:uncharacterized metal-binding protein
MPSGRVHAAASAVLSVPLSGFIFGATANSSLAMAIGGGCLAGILLTPDLDQETISSSEYSLIKYTLGLGFLWAMLWYPYARLCRHRSPLSHWPVLGTAGRLLYICLPLAAYQYFTGWQMPKQWLPLLPFAVAGLALSDALHFVFDWRWGDAPRRRSRR